MFRFLSNSKIHNKWSFTSDSLIWRILYAEPHCIIGECRDAERKSASFFSLDALTGSVYWQEKQFAEPWWIGIEAAVKGIVFFHGYAKPDMPEHKGIEACSVVGGHTLWSNPNLVFWFTSGDKICAYRDFFEKRVSYLLNAETGEITDEEINAADLRLAEDGMGTIQDILFPEALETSADQKRLSEILENKWSNILSQSIEYIEKEDLWITGFYVKEEQRGGVSPRIEILDKKTGNTIHSMTIGRNYPAPAPDLFFLVRGIVYCIENQHTLHALEIH